MNLRSMKLLLALANCSSRQVKNFVVLLGELIEKDEDNKIYQEKIFREDFKKKIFCLM